MKWKRGVARIEITEGYLKSKQRFQHVYSFPSQASVQKEMDIRNYVSQLAGLGLDSLYEDTNLEFRIRQAYISPLRDQK